MQEQIRKIKMVEDNGEQEQQIEIPKVESYRDNYFPITDLPSKYKLYPNGTNISARPLNVIEVKKLATMNEENQDLVMTDIIQRCTKGIDVKNILIADKFYILLWLRANTYKENGYLLNYECPHCKKNSTFTFSVDVLNINYISDEYVDGVEVTLPISKEIVTIKQKRIIDDFKKQEFHKSFKDKDYDKEILDLCLWLESIGENKSLWQKYTYVENKMHPYDFSTILSFVDKNTFGVNEMIDVICEHCKEGSQCGVSFRPDFFIPQV